jgi:hypothetical protein
MNSSDVGAFILCTQRLNVSNIEQATQECECILTTLPPIESRLLKPLPAARTTLEIITMKWSTLCIVALLGLVSAAQVGAQTTADAYRKAGAAYFKAGQFSQSVTAYQQVIRLAPNDADAYQQLGEAYTRLNMNKEAAAAFENQADLLIAGSAATAPHPAPVTPQTVQNTAPPATAQPATGIAQLTYKVGQRVEYGDGGKWYQAVIVDVRDDSADYFNGKMYAPYRVHPLGSAKFHSSEPASYLDTWVCCADFSDHRSQLRPVGSGPTEPVPGGEANDVVLKAMRAGTFPAAGKVSATAAAPPHAAAPARAASSSAVPAKQYHCVFFLGDHLEDTSPLTITGNGTYSGGTYTMASSILTFHGGDYDGQRAQFETSGGLPQLHILGKTGRPVIDCD